MYLARQLDLDRDVALKELSSFLADDGGFAERFLRESRVAGSLTHPNIVTVHDYFEHEGTPYIAMEFLERGSLRPHAHSLSLPQIAGVLEGLLAGLAHAHSRGIIHRDLKPENLLLTSQGSIKIADFGIAKALNQAQATRFLTATGTTIGTPTYMSPEQAMGTDVTAQSDLYSAGIIAYEMLVGRVPFEEGQTPMAILFKHVTEGVPAPTTMKPDLDPRVAEWLEKMLAKEPANRYPTALDAWDDFEEIVIAVAGPRWRRAARIVEHPSRLDTLAAAHTRAVQRRDLDRGDAAGGERVGRAADRGAGRRGDDARAGDPVPATPAPETRAAAPAPTRRPAPETRAAPPAATPATPAPETRAAAPAATPAMPAPETRAAAPAPTPVTPAPETVHAATPAATAAAAPTPTAPPTPAPVAPAPSVETPRAAPAARPQRRGPSRWLLAAAAVVVLALVAGAIALLGGGSSSSPGAATATTPKPAPPEAAPTGADTVGAAVSGDSLVLADPGGRIVRLGTALAPAASLADPSSPRALATAGASTFVADAKTVSRLRSDTLRPAAVVALGGATALAPLGASRVAAVTPEGGGRLCTVAATKIAACASLGFAPSGLGVLGNHLYVSNAATGTLVDFLDRGSSLDETRRIKVRGLRAGNPVAYGGKVYAPVERGIAVVPFGARRVSDRIALPATPTSLAVAPSSGRLFATLYSAGKLAIVDTAFARRSAAVVPTVKRPIAVTNAVEVDGRPSVYVVSPSTGSVARHDAIDGRRLGEPVTVAALTAAPLPAARVGSVAIAKQSGKVVARIALAQGTLPAPRSSPATPGSPTARQPSTSGRAASRRRPPARPPSASASRCAPRRGAWRSR